MEELLATKEERKLKATEYMKELDIFKPYIKDFKDKNWPCFYENFAGFWAFQEPEIQAKIDEIEKEHNCTVYAITHEYTDIGEFYDFLVVTQYKEEWDYLVEKYDNAKHTAFAYVWNKDDDFCSEFGNVIVQSFGGGIRRIG